MSECRRCTRGFIRCSDPECGTCASDNDPDCPNAKPCPDCRWRDYLLTMFDERITTRYGARLVHAGIRDLNGTSLRLEVTNPLTENEKRLQIEVHLDVQDMQEPAHAIHRRMNDIPRLVQEFREAESVGMREEFEKVLATFSPYINRPFQPLTNHPPDPAHWYYVVSPNASTYKSNAGWMLSCMPISFSFLELYLIWKTHPEPAEAFKTLIDSALSVFFHVLTRSENSP